MYYHLRFTPYELSSENLTTFCDKYDKYIIAHEKYKKDGITPTEPHFHVWIDSSLDLDSIRTAFKKALSIPTGGRGRNNKYYSLEKFEKGTDICYIVKQNDIRASKGFTADALRVLPCCAQTSRDPPCPKEKIEKNTSSPAALPAKKKESNFWNEIMERSILWEKKTGNKIEVEDALKIITICYFSKGLPLPYPGDRKRWAVSLVMYSKMKWEYDPKHDNIIEEEVARFMGEHMVSNKLA